MRSRVLCLLAALWLAPLAGASAQRPVRVNIESTPPGATVHLDSPDGPALGTTPLRRVAVPRGAHTLIVRLAGHEEARAPIDVARWNETFRVALAALMVIDVQPANEAARGATLRVDGQEVGALPHRMTIQPGRHLVQVGREGHATFSQWVSGASAQVVSLPVALERERPRTGAVLVAADVPGAQIFVDGEASGTAPALIDNITEGPHVIEVRADGLETHSQQVLIRAGERQTISARLQPEVSTGVLTLVTTPTGANVSVDGEPRGRSPIAGLDLSAGEHIVEVSAPGHQPVTQVVTIETGGRRALTIALEETAQPAGRIIVRASADGATVFVDGEDRGAAPAILEDPGAGVHAIVVRAPGHAELRTTCEVAPGRDCELDAELRPLEVAVDFRTTVRGATLWIDGAEVGPLPWEGNLPAGSHLVEVRAEGHEPHRERVLLAAAAEPRVFDVPLVEIGDSPEERAERAERAALERYAAVSHAAGGLPEEESVLIDLSGGWPHLVEGRMSIGVLPWLETGVAVRTFGRLTDFEGRVEASWRPIRQVALGGQVRLGGGIGPRDSNDVFMLLEGLGSLYFSDRGAFTLWIAADFHSDQYRFSGNDSDVELGNDDRQNLARLRIGGALDFVFSRRLNGFVVFEGILAGDDRRVLGDVMGGGRDDVQVYARAGVTVKL